MNIRTLELPARMDAALAAELIGRKRSGRPARIGLLTDASTGGRIDRTPSFPGLEIVAFDIDPDGSLAGFDVSTRSVELSGEIERRICDFVDKHSLDVIVEATGRSQTGAMISKIALDRRLHLVTLNARTDLALGTYLRKRSQEAVTRYVFWQSAVVRAALDLLDTLKRLDQKVVSLGAVVPAPSETEAGGLATAALSSVMIDMACLANASGISIDRPGMNGVRGGLDTIAATYRPADAGGILAVEQCIDYVLSEEGLSGAYAVVEDSEPGRGRMFRMIFSPVVECRDDWILAVAEALAGASADRRDIYRPVADVCGVAVRDVKPGERLGSPGESDYRGMAMRIDEVKWRESIPIGLLEGAMAKQVIETDETIGLENCVVDHTSRLFSLRGIQEGMDVARP